MLQQNVIDNSSKKLKRFGYTNFLNDGTFDATTESIVELYRLFDPPLTIQDYYWNATSGEFQTTPI